MQGRGQYQRIRLGAERRIGVIAGIALHRVGQRLKQGQQAVALLVFRRCQVYEGVGLAQAVQLAAENLQVLTVRAVDLAHSDDLDLIPVVSRIGQDRGNGVAGGLCGGLGVVDRLGCVGGDGKVAVQRDRRDINSFHRKSGPFLPRRAAFPVYSIANSGRGFNKKTCRALPGMFQRLPAFR